MRQSYLSWLPIRTETLFEGKPSPALFVPVIAGSHQSFPGHSRKLSWVQTPVSSRGLGEPLGSLLQVQRRREPWRLQASEHVDDLCQVSQAGAACLGPQQPFNPERRHGH